MSWNMIFALNSGVTVSPNLLYKTIVPQKNYLHSEKYLPRKVRVVPKHDCLRRDKIPKLVHLSRHYVASFVEVGTAEESVEEAVLPGCPENGLELSVLDIPSPTPTPTATPTPMRNRITTRRMKKLDRLIPQSTTLCFFFSGMSSSKADLRFPGNIGAAGSDPIVLPESPVTPEMPETPDMTVSRAFGALGAS